LKLITEEKLRKKSLPFLLKLAQQKFNAFVRKRDEFDYCISCGQNHTDYDAGHYVPQGKSSFLRFHEDNCHKEGKGCNSFDKFHLVGYRKNLIKKIGLEKVEWLEENRFTIKRWSKTELIEIINRYATNNKS